MASSHVTHSTEAGQEHEHGSAAYYLVWIALLVLTGLTWWTGRMHLPKFGLALALIIASTKATLVVLFFMHLWEQKGVNRVTFAATMAFVAIMLMGIFGDILFRLNVSLPMREDPAAIEKLMEKTGGGHGGGAHPAPGH